MGKKKKDDMIPNVPVISSKDYLEVLESDPQYSLEVDPENKYNMSEIQKKFISLYVEMKSLDAVGVLLDVDRQTLLELYSMYSTKREIARINQALYQRRFQRKMLDLEQIGGYLTSLLLDEDIPLTEKLSSKDKLEVVKMLIDLNVKQRKAIEDPITVAYQDIDVQIKEMSVETIKKLLEFGGKPEEKKDLVEKLDENDTLTPEEKAYLKTLPTKTLIELIEKIGEKGDKQNE